MPFFYVGSAGSYMLTFVKIAPLAMVKIRVIGSVGIIVVPAML